MGDGAGGGAVPWDAAVSPSLIRLPSLLSLRRIPGAGPHPQGPRGHRSAVAVDGQRAGQRHTRVCRRPHRRPVGADRGPLPDPVSRGLVGGERHLEPRGPRPPTSWPLRGSCARAEPPSPRPSLTPAPSRRSSVLQSFLGAERWLPPGAWVLSPLPRKKALIFRATHLASPTPSFLHHQQP